MTKRWLIALIALLFQGLYLQAQVWDEDPGYRNSAPKQKTRDIDWDGYMVPGIGYGVYIPRDQANLGLFHGVNVDFALYSQAKARYRAPSHWRLYGRVSILNSTKEDQGVSPMFLWGFGGDFSFESNIRRRWGIPYFGLQMGAVHQRDFGNSFQVTPLAGLHLVSTERVTLTAYGGYAFAARYYETLSGWNTGALLSITFW